MFVEIFDVVPVTGTALEGPSPDPDLIMLEDELRRLQRQFGRNVTIERYYLGTTPEAYRDFPTVATLIRERGAAVLPVTLVDGRVVKTGSYPMYGELDVHIEAWADTFRD